MQADGILAEVIGFFRVSVDTREDHDAAGRKTEFEPEPASRGRLSPALVNGQNGFEVSDSDGARGRFHCGRIMG